jgi:hypothetical protein
VIPVLLVLLPLTASVGQQSVEADESAGSGHAGWCFRGKPGSECSAFWILEFAVSGRLDEPPTARLREGPAYHVTGELGQMFNSGSRTAFGGTLYVGGDDDGSRFGVKGRFRRWLTPAVSLDLSPGILIAGTNNEFELEFPAFVGHAGLNLGDWIGLFAETEMIRYGSPEIGFEGETSPGTDLAWYAGVKLGSYSGIVATIAFPLIVAIDISSGF